MIFFQSAFINSLDYSVLNFMHELAVQFGNPFTFIMKFISLLFDKGFSVILLSIVFMFFKNTRKAGICMFLAVGIGTVLGNGIIKNVVNRQRPFASGIADIYNWWLYVHGELKTSPSFPSGHVMAVSSGMMALYFVYKQKRYIFITIVGFILVGFSRCYLMVHYFTDVLAGCLIGILSAYLGYMCFKLLLKIKLRNTWLLKSL